MKRLCGDRSEPPEHVCEGDWLLLFVSVGTLPLVWVLRGRLWLDCDGRILGFQSRLLSSPAVVVNRNCIFLLPHLQKGVIIIVFGCGLLRHIKKSTHVKLSVPISMWGFNKRELLLIWKWKTKAILVFIHVTNYLCYNYWPQIKERSFLRMFSNTYRFSSNILTNGSP